MWTNGAQDRDKPKLQVKPLRQQRKQIEEHDRKQAGESEGEDDSDSDNCKKRKTRSSTRADNGPDAEETELSDQPVMKKTKRGTKTKGEYKTLVP